jgi:predicted membrane protein
MLILQVLFMRFNVVIGGQLVAKSERGFAQFHWDFFSPEGILVCVAIFIMPYIVYYIISQFIPVFGEEEAEESKPVGRQVRRLRSSLRDSR